MEIIAERKTKTVYKDNGKTIKLFIENYPKSNILNEALNQARVEETGLNIPKLLEVTKMENRWALVSEHIEGHPFRVVSYFSGLEQISDLQIFQVFILSVLNLVPLLFPEIFL